MTGIYWLEQNEGDLPVKNAWLSGGETLVLNRLRFPKRRADWRLGRWTAKRAVAVCLGIPEDAPALAVIEVRAAQSGAPRVLLAGEPTMISISLSHSHGRAVCSVALAEIALGCDLERIEARSDSFVYDYFTAEEQAMLARNAPATRSRLSTLIWSAKESVLKALHAGLRLDTRSVIIRADDLLSAIPNWHPLQARYADGRVFDGWWRQDDEFIQTVVSAPGLNPPWFLDREERRNSPFASPLVRHPFHLERGEFLNME